MTPQLPNMKTAISVFLLLFLNNLHCIAQQENGLQYSGKFLKSIRVPIGGIGTGDILIGGRGNIEHIEVFNRPDRTRRLINTFFAIWVQEEGAEPVTKLLEQEFIPPYVENSHQYATGLPSVIAI